MDARRCHAPSSDGNVDNRRVTLLLVGVGGFLGAIARYLVDGWVSTATGAAFPWGTFVINLTGSFVLGVLFGLVIDRAVLPADLRAPVMIGFLGAYTTFSTWMLETVRLAENGAWVAAIANIGGSVAAGLAAVAVGLAVGRLA
jgi:CrcB protein